ncbi:hypothetical protein DENSPDRAFT_886262 [Dentipellis sp. KUC8613]|nr:hypothetical protein DENSPDRAFT_886262 [Dentipellis sp. KUC8613]
MPLAPIAWPSPGHRNVPSSPLSPSLPSLFALPSPPPHASATLTCPPHHLVPPPPSRAAANLMCPHVAYLQLGHALLPSLACTLAGLARLHIPHRPLLLFLTPPPRPHVAPLRPCVSATRSHVRPLPLRAAGGLTRVHAASPQLCHALMRAHLPLHPFRPRVSARRPSLSRVTCSPSRALLAHPRTPAVPLSAATRRPRALPERFRPPSLAPTHSCGPAAAACAAVLWPTPSHAHHAHNHTWLFASAKLCLSPCHPVLCTAACCCACCPCGVVWLVLTLFAPRSAVRVPCNAAVMLSRDLQCPLNFAPPLSRPVGLCRTLLSSHVSHPAASSLWHAPSSSHLAMLRCCLTIS